MCPFSVLLCSKRWHSIVVKHKISGARVHKFKSQLYHEFLKTLIIFITILKLHSFH